MSRHSEVARGAATEADEVPEQPRGSGWLPSVVAGAITCVLALLVIAFARFGADWPAQDFRAYIAQHGLSAWTNSWYGGSPLPGYSVLYPLLAASIGSSAVGVVAATAAAAAAALLAPTHTRGFALAFNSAVALCILECLVIGQTTFLLGVAFGTGALAALRRNRLLTTAALAACCSLASPLAGAFLVMAGIALIRTAGWRAAACLTPGVLGVLVAVAVDAGGGPFTYHLVTLGAISAFCLIVLALTDRRDRALRDFAIAYLLIAALAYVVDNPVGSNLNRLGRLVAPPLAILYLAMRRPRGRRRLAVVVAAGVATWWSLIPLVTAVRWGIDDPGRHLAYYRGLLGYLETQDPVRGRVEIPFTRTHTESYWVARSVPLARGWERQVDLARNDVLYSRLTAASYREWLSDNAVALVAASDLEPDIGGREEIELLRNPPSYLRLVWQDTHWRVWRVLQPTPLASAPATVTRIGQASVGLHFSSGGTSTLRLRASPMWSVTEGAASLGRTDDGWLRVRSDRPGEVTLRARVSLELLDPWNGLR